MVLQILAREKVYSEQNMREQLQGEKSLYGLSLKPELIYIKRSISGKIHSAVLAHQRAS